MHIAHETRAQDRDSVAFIRPMNSPHALARRSRLGPCYDRGGLRGRVRYPTGGRARTRRASADGSPPVDAPVGRGWGAIASPQLLPPRRVCSPRRRPVL